jgi:hypothetical protein
MHFIRMNRLVFAFKGKQSLLNQRRVSCVGTVGAEMRIVELCICPKIL